MHKRQEPFHARPVVDFGEAPPCSGPNTAAWPLLPPHRQYVLPAQVVS